MPVASISAYILNVVSGVRSSCVTAATKAPRRSLSARAPRKRIATASAATMAQAHAIISETRSGVFQASGGAA